MPAKSKKGGYNGECHAENCTEMGARYKNKHNMRHYCAACAEKANKKEQNTCSYVEPRK